MSRGKNDSATSQSRHIPSDSKLGKKTSLSLEDFVIRRDYTGARAYLEFSHDSDDEYMHLPIDQWIAFCYFHLGDYQTALNLYKHVQDMEPATEDINLNIAVCMFYLGMYEESQKLIEQTPNTPLKLRLMLHLAHKLNNVEQVAELSDGLQDALVEDQLSVASLHYLKAHYQEAIDVYKRLLLNNK